jgi:hypothetical protein
MIKADEVADLMREHRLDIEFARLRACRKLKRLAKGDIGFVIDESAALVSEKRESYSDRGSADRRRIVCKRDEIDAVMPNCASRCGSAILKLHSGRWDVFPGLERSMNGVQLAAIRDCGITSLIDPIGNGE